MSIRSKVGVAVTSVVLAFCCAALPLAAQQKSLTRQFDPIVFDAVNTPLLLGLQIDSLTAYRYNAAGDQWIAIPFQIDKVDASGSFFGNETGPIDANDEVVFMPGDAGDRAPADKWLNDAGARQASRFELEVEDPLTPGQKAWVYLYRNVTNQPTVPGYMSYDRGASQNAGTDTVFGASYKVSHASNGLPNFTAVKQGNGAFSPNLIDRLKVRVNGVAAGLLPYSVNEQANLKFESLRFATGPVRGYRSLTDTLSVLFLNQTFSFEMQYFPYSSSIIFKNARIDSADATLYGINFIRQSLDLNENAAGMTRKFFNAQNAGGVTIDGVADNSVATGVVDNRVNWFMASQQAAGSNPMALLVLVTVPQIGNARSLYYKDDSAVDANDTGDQKSFGDFGLQVTGQRIQGQFSFDFTTFHLSDITNEAATGEQFKNWQETPVTVMALEQSVPSAVAGHGGDTPMTFGLYDAYPNPFAPQREAIRLSFSTGAAREGAQLLIYNLMGQEVMRFTGLAQLRSNAGRQEVSWDGVDRFGRAVPAGVYFYKLQAGNQVAVKKFVLVR